MASNTATIEGMFGSKHTYFVDSPVVITVKGLSWPESSPFKVVRVEVIYNSKVVGEFRADTGGQESIDFDISSALKAIWAGYDFSSEVGKDSYSRGYRSYTVKVYTEYLAADGEYTTTESPALGPGLCLAGGLTALERHIIGDGPNADASYWENKGGPNGDASTKPKDQPERVGSTSPTSKVDVDNSGTKGWFYAYNESGGPAVLRDSVPYIDFEFVNRRGAVETCSGRMLEAMSVDVDTKQYRRLERPSFKPSRSLMAIANGGTRSWSMSSGYQTREWAEWWAQEFLMARQWWMWCDDRWLPVIVTPAKKSTGIYDRAKQQMPSVEFTVTLALEG